MIYELVSWIRDITPPIEPPADREREKGVGLNYKLRTVRISLENAKLYFR